MSSHQIPYFGPVMLFHTTNGIILKSMLKIITHSSLTTCLKILASGVHIHLKVIMTLEKLLILRILKKPIRCCHFWPTIGKSG